MLTWTKKNSAPYGLCKGYRGLVIDKIRYFLFHASSIWHVDVYEGILDGVVLAEIELANLEQTFIFPDWIGDEVTADPRYSKINMVAARLAKTGQDSVTR
jgi:CYTH domain-containing protein